MSAQYYGTHVGWRGRPAGHAESDTENYNPFRRMACMMLLSGYLGAQGGSLADKKWIEGPEACLMADLVGLPYWPPRPDQFYSLDELEARARALSGPVRVSKANYGQQLSAADRKERRRRQRALQDELFANVTRTTSTTTVAAMVSLWGQFVVVGAGD